MKLSLQEKELYANKVMDPGNLILTGVVIGIILGQEGIHWPLAVIAFWVTYCVSSLAIYFLRGD